jgi:hypothetical protein
MTASYDTYEDTAAGYGWMLFAGVLLLIGTINFIEGIAARPTERVGQSPAVVS